MPVWLVLGFFFQFVAAPKADQVGRQRMFPTFLQGLQPAMPLRTPAAGAVQQQPGAWGCCCGPHLQVMQTQARQGRCIAEVVR